MKLFEIFFLIKKKQRTNMKCQIGGNYLKFPWLHFIVLTSQPLGCFQSLTLKVSNYILMADSILIGW